MYLDRRDLANIVAVEFKSGVITMNAFHPNTSLFSGWQQEHSELFDLHTIKLKHRLRETGLFSIDAIGKLIDQAHPNDYVLTTMGHDKNVKEWRHGDKGNLSGSEVIETIRNGRVWMNLFPKMAANADYNRILNQIFDECESLVPGLRTYRRNMTLLISSPNIQVYYHADTQGQSLWQLEGKKRVYVYPYNKSFVPDELIENIVMQEAEEEIPYEPWYDKYAEVHELEGGQMLHWPLYGPHRVENFDCLNISVTTEHWTREIRNAFAVRYGNGILRRTLGLKGLSTEPRGFHVYPKAAATLAWKRLKLEKARSLKNKIEFRLDPDAEGGIQEIEPYLKGS